MLYWEKKRMPWVNGSAAPFAVLVLAIAVLLLVGTPLSAGVADRAPEHEIVAGTAVLPNSEMAGPTFGDQGYGYCAYDPSGTLPDGPVTFALNNPPGLTSLAPTSSLNFIAGACWVEDEATWYGSQYGGGLYSIDHTTGSMTFVANTAESLSGIEYDDASGIMYGTDGYSLYTVDWTTGATTLVGSHNITPLMIGLAGDGAGNMYGVTVDFSAISDLYSVDLATGNASTIASTGGQLCYAQDLAFDKDGGVLYSAAYFNDGTPPGLYEIDTSTAAMTAIGDFPNGMEVSGFAIPYAAGTISAEMTCSPSAGTLPLSSAMTVELVNQEPLRPATRIAAVINAALAGGTSYNNWRAGSTNVSAGTAYVTSWFQNIPALGSVVGDNVFTLVVEDVTPSPYNQPPYPASGDTDTSACTITGISP